MEDIIREHIALQMRHKTSAHFLRTWLTMPMRNTEESAGYVKKCLEDTAKLVGDLETHQRLVAQMHEGPKWPSFGAHEALSLTVVIALAYASPMVAAATLGGVVLGTTLAYYKAPAVFLTVLSPSIRAMSAKRPTCLWTRSKFNNY